MRIHFMTVIITGLLLIVQGCGGSSVRPDSDKVVKASADQMPGWVLKPTTDSKYVYFVGMSGKADDIKGAKALAGQNAVGQLVEYIGFRATRKFNLTRKGDMDSINGFTRTLEETIEGKGSASVVVDVVEVYYEQYADGKYMFYSLIRFPKAWVEKERERLTKLVADQRQKSKDLLEEAESLRKQGRLNKSVETAMNALLIAEKAAENSDVYDDAKTFIQVTMSGLSFSLESQPKYVYTGGGSDIIKIGAYYQAKPAEGIMTVAYENQSNAQLLSPGGNTTANDGLVSYEVTTLTPGTSKVNLVFTFNMQKFNIIKDADPDFYKALEKLQSSKALTIGLPVMDKDKAWPGCVVALDIEVLSSGMPRVEYNMKFQQAMSTVLTSVGYNVVSVEIPDNLLKQASANSDYQKKIVDYIKEVNPDIKRVYWAIRTPENRGKNQFDVEVFSYRVQVALINVKNMKQDKGWDFASKGLGQSKVQAQAAADKNIPAEFQNLLTNLSR